MIINLNQFGNSGGGSGSGSTVTWRQDVTAGTQIAQITINGTSQSVYTPDIYTEKSHTEESEEVISRALNELSANAGGGGDSLPEIDTLPANPVDGSVYNYQGRLIKYVDGAGNWGEWILSPLAKSSYSSSSEGGGDVSAVLNYAVIPSSMDGQLLLKSSYSNSNLYFYYDETNTKINVYLDSASTVTPDFQVSKDGVPVTCISSASNNRWIVTWTEGRILLTRPEVYRYGAISNECSVATSAAHYELVENSLGEVPATTGNSCSVYVDGNGRVTGRGFDIQFNNNKINNSTVRTVSNAGWSMPNIYAPTASGETGTILVSAGNTAPVWQTLQTTLGIKAIWTGTQDEYDALGTYDNATLYFIVEEE